MDYEFSKDKEYCYNFVFFRKGLNDLIYSRCLINGGQLYIIHWYNQSSTDFAETQQP